MNPKLRRPLILIGLITIIVIAIFVVPRGISLYYQIRGGQHIEYVLRFTQGIPDLELACEELPSSSGDEKKDVEQGIAGLNRALIFNGSNAQANYYLAQAYCLMGEPYKAKDNYFKYTLLKPDNPLGYIGLGFASEKLGDRSSAKRAWKSAGLNPEDFNKIGDEEFRAESYEYAISWYERAELMGGEQSTYSKFNWSVAAILSGNRFPTHLDPLEIPIYPLSGMLEIEGSELQWFRPENNYWNIRYGQYLSEHQSGDPGVGGIWWRGAAVAIVHSPCMANYKIQVRAIHNSLADGVGQLLFEDNLSPFATFIMSENWQEYEADITLSKGYHLLGIRYVKDVGDVLVDWMHISQETDCESKY